MQKYRFYLSKLLKENEVKTSQGMKQQDFTRPGSFGFQTSTLYTGNNTLLIDMGTRICREADMKATASILSVDLKETSASNFLDRQRQVLVLKPFFPILSTTNHTTTQTRNEVLMEQFKQPPDQDPDLCALLDDDFSHALQSASQHLLQVDLQYSAYAVGLETSVPERDKSGSVMITPLCSQSRSDNRWIADPKTSDAISCFKSWHEKSGGQSELLERLGALPTKGICSRRFLLGVSSRMCLYREHWAPGHGPFQLLQFRNSC